MDIVLRAVIIYVVVFTFTRVLGRRELSTLQPSQIGSIDDIRWAVLETNGDISFIEQPSS
jgi:uncharacterized membrane protein YcaP (DUF421 family)